jgi:hypothetical protein
MNVPQVSREHEGTRTPFHVFPVRLFVKRPGQGAKAFFWLPYKNRHTKNHKEGVT